MEVGVGAVWHGRDEERVGRRICHNAPARRKQSLPTMTAGDRVAMPLLLVILMLCLGVARGAAAHPMGEPPGQMVDIGGRRMHLNCLGHGAPTVLIDIGLGAASLPGDRALAGLAALGGAGLLAAVQLLMCY